MKIKTVSLLLFLIVGLSTSRIILEKEFEEFKTAMRSSFDTIATKLGKKASTKAVKSEIVNVNKESENFRNETTSDVVKLKSIIRELQRTISKLEGKVKKNSEELLDSKVVLDSSVDQLNSRYKSVINLMKTQRSEYNSALNSQVQQLDSNIEELTENLDDLEQNFSQSDARSRNQISQLYSSIDEMKSDLKSFSSCTFQNYVTNYDDVVVAKHGETYSGLTEVSYNFLASNAGSKFLNKYTRDHAHFYGFRNYYSTWAVICSSDNKHISTANDEYITFSKGDYVMYGERYLNFRPKLCGATSSVCQQDWSLIINKPGSHESYCSNSNYNNIGLFVKTAIYNKIVAYCSIKA